MAKVIDFNARLTAKNEAADLDRLREFFVTKLLPYMTHSEKLEFIAALETKDADKYFAITEPIIMRNAIREINGKGE